MKKGNGNQKISRLLILMVIVFAVSLITACEGLRDEQRRPTLPVLFGSSLNLSSDNCNTCHGDPPRYGQRQQWEKSGHSNYALAREEGPSPSCTRCHSRQGFLLWLKQGWNDPTLGIQGSNGTATDAEMVAMGFTADKLEPQTCVTCHDTSSPPGTVRVMDNTPLLPAGFYAKDIGKGAVCIMCHNSRTTIRDWTVSTGYGVPHASVQGDVLMGQNVYLAIAQPQRSPYARKDACVTCHMGEKPSQTQIKAYLSRPQQSAHYKFKETCPT